MIQKIQFNTNLNNYNLGKCKPCPKKINLSQKADSVCFTGNDSGMNMVSKDAFKVVDMFSQILGKETFKYTYPSGSSVKVKFADEENDVIEFIFKNRENVASTCLVSSRSGEIKGLRCNTDSLKELNMLLNKGQVGSFVSSLIEGIYKK